MDVVLFLIFAFLAVAAAINLIVQSHPISSALSLVGVMVSLAVLYLLLGGEFIAMAQIIVYAGAVMVLFVFVIMLLNASKEAHRAKSSLPLGVAIPLIAAVMGALVTLIYTFAPKEVVRFGGYMGGTPANFGRTLFTTYVLPFEVTSVLILIAILGAIVLARKEI